jgi:hypothetical protein
MKIVEKISVDELKDMARSMYGDLVKADVDIVNKTVIVDMGMHADGEAQLLELGSSQDDIWGINLHPDKYGTANFIEFDSMINIRPGQKNPTRDVVDPAIRATITQIIAEVVHE